MAETNPMTLDDVVLELMVANESIDNLNKGQASRLKDLNFGIHIVAERLAGLIEIFTIDNIRADETRIDNEKSTERTQDLLENIDDDIKNQRGGKDGGDGGGFFGSGLLDMFRNVMPDLLTGLLPGIIGAVTGLSVGFLGSFFKEAVWKNLSKGTREFIENFGTKMKNLWTRFEEFLSPITKRVKMMGGKVGTWMEPIVNWFKSIGGHFKELKALFTGGGAGGGAFSKIIGNFMNFFTKFKAIGSVIGKILGKLALPITILMSVWDGIKGAMEGYKEGGVEGAIKGALKGVITGLVGWVWDMIMGLAKWIYRAIGWDEAAQSLEGWDFKTIINGFFDIIDWILYGIGFVLGTIARPFVHPKEFFSEVWDGIKLLPGLIWDGMKAVWDFLANIGKIVLKSVLPPPNSALGALIPNSVYEWAGLDSKTGAEKAPAQDAGSQKYIDELATGISSKGKPLTQEDKAARRQMLEARGMKPEQINQQILSQRAKNVAPLNSTSGQSIDGISKENMALNTATPTPVIINGGGGGGGGSQSVQVNNVTYQPNNIPDRSMFMTAGAFA